MSAAGTNLMRYELALCRQLWSAVVNRVVGSTTIIIVHAFCCFGLVPAQDELVTGAWAYSKCKLQMISLSCTKTS